MRKYKVIDVSEAQLEDLVRRAPELIEEGLRFVDHQALTGSGRLDVLLVDSGGALVVAELKAGEDDGMLGQGIDYYDYLVRSLDGLAQAYGHHAIDPKQEPRLFLVAPSFSVTLLNRIKWVNLRISLFTFQCIQFEDAIDEIVAVYKEIATPTLPPRPVVHRLDDRYDYITDAGMRAMAQKLVAQMKEWGRERVVAEATKYDISVKVSGRVFAYVSPRRKHLVVYTNDAEGKWISYPINSQADLEAVVPLIRTYFDRITAGRIM